MPALPAATAAVRLAIRDLLRDRLAIGALRPGDLVLAACSGGADSLALAAQTAFCAPRLGVRAGLVTVDHGLQEGSALQAARVAEQARVLGLDPVLIETAVAPADSSGGPEATARRLRLEAFETALERTGARAILLGHTMDDQAETVLLGLARGSGVRTLAGIAAVRGRLWRPLLSVRRAQTEQCCAELGLEVWHDPTNAPDGPWRTAAGSALPRAALRSRVLPALAEALGQDPVPALARTAELAGTDADHLDALADEALTQLLLRAGDAPARDSDVVPTLSVAVAELHELPPAILGRVVRRLLLRAGAPPGALGHTHVQAALGLLTDWHGQGPVVVPGGIEVSRAYGRLSLLSPTPRRGNSPPEH